MPAQLTFAAIARMSAIFAIHPMDAAAMLQNTLEIIRAPTATVRLEAAA